MAVVKFVPVPERALRAYARRLQQTDPTLTKDAALSQANRHEGERAAAHERNNAEAGVDR